MTAITCAGCKHAYTESALFCPNCGRPKARTPAGDALIGKVLGERFQVIELIGQGGSGTIYRAEHVTLRRRVAIKILHDELSRDDLAVERFRREATTVAEIDNEHIVEIHDFGRTPDGRLYLAMELLEGENLEGVLAREKQLSVERTADILIQVGEALMEAHAIGYVHRDLRPRNIYLAVRRGKANFVKLLDFGLAKLVDSDTQAASTSLGMTFGDPRYMSPEQARGDRIDRRADIYQLGCVAYEMLTGAPPFTGNRVFDILTKQVSEIPQPLPTRRPGVPLWMEAACAKMLAKDSENRFATTTRMVEALRRGLETGEVMEDEVARRRESVPPPSVSRVMQRMGISQDPTAPHPALAPLPPLPAAKPATDAPAQQPKQDSVDLVRKRTGTPQLGVPVVPSSSEVLHQSAVTGTIEPRVETRARVRPPTSPNDSVPVPRGKRPTQDPGISQAWYDEGDQASEESSEGRAYKARKNVSPSTTDLSLYDEVPRANRKGVIFGIVGVAVVLGGLAFAVTRGDETKSTTPPKDPTPVAGVTVDAAPSTIITSPTEDAAAADPADAAAIKPSGDRKPSNDTRPTGPRNGTRPTTPDRTPTGPIDVGAFVPGGDPTPRMTPDAGVPSYPVPADATVVVIVPPKDPPKDPGAGSGSGVSGGPQDPYGNDQPAGGSAQDHAKQGQQQLKAGDIANAAQNFRKALELDPNNATATIGMGEIAFRQALWGDALSHLNKAARLAPRNAHVFVLLGETYLRGLANNKAAADNFKKALQIDPNNARARDGYNEASSKVPPPTDDE